ncbi:dihydrolipoyl dehydrogenase [Formicincola oecophyllae]|uniref:Dihydrolipoyl dehydrogenase n=1 Tax=Formicincola oecophyllae TaxID=2558361 RepID=A0A4Y6U9V2_9PROT|nr:dihydrolipoyl dehydrogenase [Formicincola oecophyllae]QDH13994.1 dihydrolipoyl dehydrogenase [Formicincola oecophyllae]
MSEFFDLTVIGGGPGGYVAALRAAQLGMKVALVEERHLGGICLNWGCIPTKALLRSAEIYHLMGEAEAFGVQVGERGFDLQKMVQRSRAVADRMGKGVQHLLKKAGVTVLEGRGRLAGQEGEVHRVAVTEGSGKESTPIRTPHVILATGARGRQLPGVDYTSKAVWTAREAMTPDIMPQKLLVVGSGAIGVEFASFYRDLGAEVTIIEAAERIMPAEDAEISQAARKAFEKRGMAIHTDSRLEKLEVLEGGKGVRAHVNTPQGPATFEADRVISAAGVVGNSENLGLDGTAVKVERSFVEIDDFCRTGERGIYAIGDLAGPPCLAHKASHEGIICVEKIAGRLPQPLHPLNIPGCTYARPQVASVGMSEAAARAAGHEVRVGRFPFMANGKAVAMGEPDGMTKTVFDAKTGELLGAHMIGAEVTEMIQGFTIARTSELTEAELVETVFPHPTISETMHEATLAAHEGALHI